MVLLVVLLNFLFSMIASNRKIMKERNVQSLGKFPSLSNTFIIIFYSAATL